MLNKVRLIIACIFLLSVASPAYALLKQDTKRIIYEVFDFETKAITSEVIYLGDKDKVSLIVSYEEDGGGGSFAHVHVQASPHTNTWVGYDVLLDQNGTDDPQPSMRYDVAATDYFYFPMAAITPYARVTVETGHTSAFATSHIKVWINWQRRTR